MSNTETIFTNGYLMKHDEKTTHIHRKASRRIHVRPTSTFTLRNSYIRSMGTVHKSTLMQWILFYCEPTMQYYIYNGTNVINIMPSDKERILWDDKVEVLDEVLKNTRKKQFTHNKQRHMIMGRGTMFTE